MSAGEARQALSRVHERIAGAARRAGRDPDDVVLVGVTKTVPVDRILPVVEAGLTHLGENRVQEAGPKIEALARIAAPVVWHLIGHLQSNKAGRAAGLFGWIDSIDRADLVTRLDRAVPPGARPINVLLQVDLAHEATKHGADAGRIDDLASAVERAPRIRLQGLMTIPPLFDDPEASRPFFARLRRLRDELAARGRDLPHLSMGMSNDLEVAVEEGATMVRVGRALFGDRPPPPPGGSQERPPCS